MQRLLFFLAVTTIFIVLTFVVRFLMRQANKKIWQKRWLDKAAFHYPYLFLLSLVLMILSASLARQSLMMKVSITLGFIFLVLSITLLLSFLAVFAFYFGFKLWPKINKNTRPFSSERRRALKVTASVAPILLLGTSVRGFAGAFSKVQIPVISFHFKNLPTAFENFRILHLSDLHLGYYFNLKELENLIGELMRQNYDLVLITGDCADDVNQLADALHLIDQIPTRLPKFFSLGNHEYFRDFPRTLRILEKSNIQLLRNEAVTLVHNSSKMRLIGIDDPVYMGREITSFLDNFLRKATNGSGEESFNLLMSHRPQALDLAPDFGLDLVLAGHTHGGQVGFNGRSVFENWGIHKYLWGKYQKGNSQLYTSAGVGHWFPFRLGCPPEAPVIELKQG